jgi:predicted nucleic acid-binding Zn ribbon protein
MAQICGKYIKSAKLFCVRSCGEKLPREGEKRRARGSILLSFFILKMH